MSRKSEGCPLRRILFVINLRTPDRLHNQDFLKKKKKKNAIWHPNNYPQKSTILVLSP